MEIGISAPIEACDGTKRDREGEKKREREREREGGGVLIED